MVPLDVTPRRAVGSPNTASTPADATMPPKARAGTVANDDDATASRKHDENPLWNLAIVVAFLCGVAALMIAFS
jgi:hypothetical protein